MDTYNTSLPMSTYLMAFSLSEYHATLSFDGSNRTFRVFGRPELVDRGEAVYANSFAKRAVKIMENYTKIDYVTGKMDLIGVPNQYYKIGAMENWGMITFRYLKKCGRENVV